MDSSKTAAGGSVGDRVQHTIGNFLYDELVYCYTVLYFSLCPWLTAIHCIITMAKISDFCLL